MQDARGTSLSSSGRSDGGFVAQHHAETQEQEPNDSDATCGAHAESSGSDEAESLGIPDFDALGLEVGASEASSSDLEARSDCNEKMFGFQGQEA